MSNAKVPDPTGPHNSNLSHPLHDVDIVVATSQRAINATMLGLLRKITEDKKGRNVVTSVWIQEKSKAPGVSGELVMRDWDSFLSDAVFDPFDEKLFPDGCLLPTKRGGEGHQGKLSDSRLKSAVRMKFGLPQEGLNLPPLPPILRLNDSSSAVEYNMLCAEITVLLMTVVTDDEGDSTKVLRRYSQKPGNPWIFKSTVDLTVAPVVDPKESCPKEVQEQLAAKNKGDEDYSVQRLILDIDRAAFKAGAAQLQVGESLDSVEKQALAAVTAHFGQSYWASIKATGRTPTLGFQIVRKPDATPAKSSLVATSLEMRVGLPVNADGTPVKQLTDAQRGLSTLNYVSTVDHRPLRTGAAFTWNWLPPAAADLYHGCVAISRPAFARWLCARLDDNVAKSCYTPSVNWKWVTFAPELKFSSTLATDRSNSKWEFPPSERCILKYGWTSASQDWSFDALLALYQAGVTYTYELEVSVEGSTVVIRQVASYRMVINVKGHVENKVVKQWLAEERHLLGTDGGGRITSQLTKWKDEKDDKIEVGGWTNFLTGINSDSKRVYDISSQQGSGIDSIDLDDLRGFVFPGGKAFTFKEVAFSKHGDLVAHITYIEPDGKRFLEGTW